MSLSKQMLSSHSHFSAGKQIHLFQEQHIRQVNLACVTAGPACLQHKYSCAGTLEDPSGCLSSLCLTAEVLLACFDYLLRRGEAERKTTNQGIGRYLTSVSIFCLSIFLTQITSCSPIIVLVFEQWNCRKLRCSGVALLYLNSLGGKTDLFAIFLRVRYYYLAVSSHSNTTFLWLLNAWC